MATQDKVIVKSSKITLAQLWEEAFIREDFFKELTGVDIPYANDANIIYRVEKLIPLEVASIMHLLSELDGMSSNPTNQEDLRALRNSLEFQS